MSEEKKTFSTVEARKLAQEIAQLVDTQVPGDMRAKINVMFLAMMNTCGAGGYRELVELLSYANRVRN